MRYRQVLTITVSHLWSRGPRALDVLQGVTQLTEPVIGVLADQPHTPGQGVTAAARHTGLDERVQHPPLRLPQPRHHRHRELGEHHRLGSALDAPRHLAGEPVLGLTGDVDPLLARLLTEALHVPGDRTGTLRGRGALGDLGLGQPTDHADLLAVEHDLRSTLEPRLRQAAGEPAPQLFQSLIRSHVIIITHYRRTSHTHAHLTSRTF